MRNIAAYLLLQAGGKENPTAADIKTLLAVVGIETDEDRLKLLVSELSGKSVNEVSTLEWSSSVWFMVSLQVIAQGLGKLASVSTCVCIFLVMILIDIV